VQAEATQAITAEVEKHQRATEMGQFRTLGRKTGENIRSILSETKTAQDNSGQEAILGSVPHS